MSRPFRFQPPAVPLGFVPRPRPLAAIEQRWRRRLLTVVAGPGFGKTSLLAASLAHARTRGGHDVWIACEPADGNDAHLAQAVFEAIGLPAEGGLPAICDWVWAQTPEPVCFVFDDVHEVSAGSEGADWIKSLLTELPRNGHVVLASRDAVPVPTGRLAVSGELCRIQEADLVLDEQELIAFAEARGVDVRLLRSTGGWPALAELTASAGADLILDYLWEEVLGRLGAERAGLLARFAVVGGGDDEVVSALAGESASVDTLVDGLPLVQRSPTGLATLHPLWTPPLRALLDGVDADAARIAAATVHRSRLRLHEALDLLAEAGAWDAVLATIREAATDRMVRISSTDFERWHKLLPSHLRQDPIALLAHGLAIQRRDPGASISPLATAADGFRRRGDVDGEVTAIGAHGLVLWWSNDGVGLLGLHLRIVELAAAGSPAAHFLEAVGVAAVAHLQGDSAAVFAAVAEVDELALPGWMPIVHWLRSVAHRRDGNLGPALAELDAGHDGASGALPFDLEHAGLRTRWLLGEVDDVCAALPALRHRYAESGDWFNATGVALELAARVAWLGDPDAAEEALAQLATEVADSAAPMVVAMRLMASAAIAVATGDETQAGDLLREQALKTIGRPDGWYWRDRGAVALVRVLVPDTAPLWAEEPLGPPHRVGLDLAEVLIAVRAGDLDPVSTLHWPESGIMRAHLPTPWVVELLAAGHAAGNPPPIGLVEALGSHLRPALRALADRPLLPAQLASATTRLLADLPVPPNSRIRIGVLGSLELLRDGEPVVHPDLRRGRVRELLCVLVVRGRVRREQISEELWPDLDDPGRNLRVTLSYLRRILQPDRTEGDPSSFVLADGTWLELVGGDHLTADVWDLDAHLDEAERAEATGSPAAALASYGLALPLWRGEPFADLPYADSVAPTRARLRTRYVAAAVRAGELVLAAGVAADARHAAEHALAADPTDESAHNLLVRTFLAEGDHGGARRAVDACRTALAELGLEPTHAFFDLVALAREDPSAGR